MESKKKAFSLYDIVMIGLMAAVVFVVTMFLSIRIPTPTGTTMIKLANAFVLLCGLLLGPVRGGLAAGIGSMIFDLMTPEYAPEAWITFVRFFLMAWLCGVIAYAGAAAAKKFARNLVACLAGAVPQYAPYHCSHRRDCLYLLPRGSRQRAHVMPIGGGFTLPSSTYFRCAAQGNYGLQEQLLLVFTIPCI